MAKSIISLGVYDLYIELLIKNNKVMDTGRGSMCHIIYLSHSPVAYYLWAKK